MKSKTTKYREIIDALKKEFFGGNYEDYSCGNTMGLYVRNPVRCETLFNRFDRLKNCNKKKI